MKIWKDIPGAPGFKASMYGHIGYFVNGVCMATCKERLTTRGYLYAKVWIDDEHREMGVHRLVAMAYHDNPENKPQVNHKNGDKTDNRPENLEWVTCSENHLHAYRELGKISWATGKALHRKFTDEQVREIRAADGTLAAIGEKYGVHPSTVCNIKRRKSYANID